jgi:hypothetical protein
MAGKIIRFIGKKKNPRLKTFGKQKILRLIKNF